MKDWVVGVDLGGTKIELGLVDPQDRIVARYRTATAEQKGPQAVVKRILTGVAEVETALPAAHRIASLGICSPGPVDHTTGMLLDPPNLQGLHHTPLRQMLEDRLRIPVVLEHDAKAAAVGDFYFGAGRDADDMVYVVVGTGVGSALIVDSDLYRGRHNAAGEIGHTTLDRNGPLCTCGNRGCVETFISGPWLGYHYIQAKADSDPSATGRISGERVAQLAAENDPFAMRVMADAGEALGTAVATIAMIMDVDLFVIGGSVVKAGDLLLEPARLAVPRHSHSSVGARVRIVPTALGDDGPVLGCAWLARQLLNKR